jgi:hypothetical protein
MLFMKLAAATGRIIKELFPRKTIKYSEDFSRKNQKIFESIKFQTIKNENQGFNFNVQLSANSLIYSRSDTKEEFCQLTICKNCVNVESKTLDRLKEERNKKHKFLNKVQFWVFLILGLSFISIYIFFKKILTKNIKPFFLIIFLILFCILVFLIFKRIRNKISEPVDLYIENELKNYMNNL